MPSRTDRDLVNNSNERQSALDECIARHQGLLDWHAKMIDAAPQSVDTTVDGAKNAPGSLH